MNILFLDDDDSRQRAFKGRIEPHVSLYAAWAVWDARALLSNVRTYDACFLDHDLGNLTYVPTDDQEHSGNMVAKHIAELPAAKYPKLVVLHSLNDAGWRAQAATLRPTGIRMIRAPFGHPSFWSILAQLQRQPDLARQVA
jgi:hypothetical protein